MNRLVALCVLLAAPFMEMSEVRRTQIVIDFCETTLLQSQNDATSCSYKPDDYSMEDKDEAVLVYLCCLGYFNDVTINYMPFLEKDFVEYIGSMTNEKLILSIAKFIMACKSDTRRVSKAHFLSWMDQGQNASACPAV